VRSDLTRAPDELVRRHSTQRHQAADFGEHCQRGEPDPLRPFPALILFAVAAALGWIGNRFLPEYWMYNPLL
jgi:hypothetical protein